MTKKPLICKACGRRQTILEAVTSKGLSCVACGGAVRRVFWVWLRERCFEIGRVTRRREEHRVSH